MLKSCPNPVDVQDILFKLRCRLKVFNNKEVNNFSRPHSLISCASRYGLLFVGSNSKTLQVLQSKCIENYCSKDKDVNNYPRRSLSLPSPPIHICVNCDSTLLAIVVEKDTCSTVIFYDVMSFYKQTVTVVKELRLSSTPGVTVREVNWNPALPAIFTACKSDGTLGVYEIKGNAVDINELPTAAETTSFCWSPKGKQIAVGSRNGKITQYKPDLKAVKIINEPPLEGPHSLISLQWVSNYQFIGVYRPADPEGQAKLVVVDSSKTGETSYTNYDDVCYSGNGRVPQFYMIMQQHWNLLMVASSNSTEVGVLGSVADTWTQWIISDSARAELPLSSDKQDTLPVGLALDISPSKPVPWGEDTIPPCPYLLILSHHGVLCVFDVVNLKQGVPSICCPVDNVPDTSGLAQFVVEEDKGPVQEKDIQVAQMQSTISFGAPQVTASESQPFATPQASPFKTENFKSTPLLTNPAFPSQTSTPFSASLKPNTTGQPFLLTNPGASLFAPKTDPQAMFGGQAVLPAAKTSQPSTFLVGETVITPASKDPTPVTTSNKYSSIFTTLNTPSFAPSSAQGKPVIVAELPSNISTYVSSSSHSVPFTSTPQIPRAESKISAKPVNLPLKQASDPKAIVDERVKEETDALLAKMVKDECIALDSELKALLHQGRKVNINIGSDQEKLEMLKQMETLEEFIKEIVDISLGENAEVHNLKQNLILSWAWYEEALSRYNVSKDDTMTLLLKAQPLNSATEKRQSDMKKLIYYLESQLSQVNKALDEQWEKFQDYAKKTHRVQMPTMEAIFQSMVRQNAVLQKQIYILKDISSRIKQKKLSSTGPSLFLSLEDSTTKIENDLKNLQIELEDPHRTIHEKILQKEKHFTNTKRNKLRGFLKSHEVVHVTVVKPQMNSTLPFSPGSKNREIYSILGARMSPVQKVPVARNLEFPHSTLAKENRPDIKPTSAPPNTPAHTESQRTFTFKNLKTSVSSTMTTNSGASFFTPKSVHSNFSQSINQPTLPPSSPSAFVPTTQSTKLQSFTQMSEKSNLGNISTPTFSFASTPTGTIPKTNTINVTESLPSFKANTTQFNFGSSITITPINKKSEVPSSGPVSTSSSTSSNFSFGGPTKTSTDVPKKATPTSEILSQTKSVPLFGSSTTSSSTFSFGSMASITASSDSTIKTPSGGSISSITTPTKSLVFGTTPSSTTFSTIVTQPSSTITTTSTFLSFGVASSNAKPSIFGSSLPTASSAPFLSKAVISSPTTTVGPTSTVTSSTSFFGSSPQTLISGSTTIPSETISMFANKPETTSTPFGSSPVSSSPSPSVGPTSSVSDMKVSASMPISITTTASPILEASSTTTPSIFAAGSPPVSVPTSTPTVSIFGFSNITTASNVFGSEATPTTSGTSIFGSSSSSPVTPIFGVPTVGSVSSTPIFGGSTTSSSTSTSIFGGGMAKTSSNSTSIFGTSMPSTTQASAFGANPPQSQIFGTPTTAAVFGNTTVPTSSILTSQQGSIFSGGSTTQTSVFGTVSTASTQPSIFGSVTSAATTQPSIFGSLTSPAITQPSIFGSVTSTTTTQPSIFASTTTSASPVFGNATTTQSSFGSAFGQPGSIFATPKTTSSTFGSAFGSTSIFGSTPATTAQGFGQTQFGSTATPAFGTPTTASSIFGSGTGFASVSSSSNVFGSSADSPKFSFAPAASNATTGTGAFGFGNLNVGNVANVATTSSSIFGTAPANPFGSGTSIFGSPPSTSSSIFGTNTSNTQSGFGTSTFGSSPAFSQQPAFGQSAFGGTPSFGSPQAGPFSTGGTGVGQSGFGSSPSFVGASTFGGSPQPAFGASPSFGGAPAFGAAPAFGSPPKVFGSNTPTAAFGSAATGSPGFGNLATQNTVGFGNLAQQAATPTSTPFSGNSSFSSWR